MFQIETLGPAPLLNTPDFFHAFGGASGTEIPRNAFNHPLHYEFVALPGTPFSVEEICPKGIYRVATSTYPAPALYLDSRLARLAGPQRARPQMPPREELARRMERLLGTPYVWGGNWSAGIPELLRLHPPRGILNEETKRQWTLAGIDCSGLLYETTGGLTPRNTSALVHWGRSVAIEGLEPKALVEVLEPMDLIVWKGHVWFVLSRFHSIESKSPFGVICRPLLKRLEETCRERKGRDKWDNELNPNDIFVVRRLY